MKYYQEILLKNNIPCVIRNAQSEDAQAVIDNFFVTHKETDYLLSYENEITFTADGERVYLQKKEESEREVQLLAVINGKVVGMAGLDLLGNKQKIKHRAVFGVSVEKAYWGLGIGGALTKACIACAKKGNIKQVELEVVAENAAALSLYKKLGFVEYGRNPKGFLSRTSGWQELVLMRLELD